MLTDSHVHLDLIAAAPGFHALFPEQAALQAVDRVKAVIRAAREAGVYRLLHVSTDYESHFTVYPAAAVTQGFVSCAMGFLPHQGCKSLPDTRKFKQILEESQICAIGEIGLDFSRDNGTPRQQMDLFAEQLALAMEYRLPVIIHSRDAAAETLQVLREFPGVTGAVHCFTYGPDEAAAFADCGLAVSFSGILTYPNRTELIRAAACALPDELLLVETDAPYLAPRRHRGQLNLPWYVAETAGFLAELRGQTADGVVEYTGRNCERIFRLDSLEGVCAE